MQQWYNRVITGEAVGVIPALLRWFLSIGAMLYSQIVHWRNIAYDYGWKRVTRLPVPVISVGNITTGGTGKTPTVIMIAKCLAAAGLKPAILTRGYGAKTGECSDEVMVMRQECPDVPVLANPDRIAGGKEAIARYQANVLILDDGFQHRRLARDLDIVLVDATSPLGVPGMLPRGTWREGPASLARTQQIILTRCEQVSSELTDLAAGLLTQWINPRRIYKQVTEVVGVFDQNGDAVQAMDKTVLAFAGIANPDGFVRTLSDLGMHVSAGCWFNDHHRYVPELDFLEMRRLTAERHLAAWVTTAKDWVKLRDFQPPAPLWHVRIAARITGVAGELWRQSLADLACKK
ncbi:MAG: tetraacyldisaccharide 4'-kinase [Phycisphaerae bacterium]